MPHSVGVPRPVVSVLEVSRLRIAREDKVILRGLDWRVEPGQAPKALHTFTAAALGRTWVYSDAAPGPAQRFRNSG